MAIDSREKRQSAYGVFHVKGIPAVTPNAANDQEWRQEVFWGYSGILAEELIITQGPGVGVGSIITNNGVGKLSAIDNDGVGETGIIVLGFGVGSIISNNGVGKTGLINNDGVGREGDI